MRRTVLAIVAAGLVAACGSADRGLRRLDSGLNGPDEFAVLPSRPLSLPQTSDLPPPTPGGRNLADPDPLGDAMAALGGAAGAGPAGDAALIAATGRYGVDPGIRAALAEEDAAFRRRAGALAFNPLGVDRYFQAYARQALDAYAELARFRAAGVAVPSAPPARAAN
jgi:hypothetical protein